MYRFGYHLYQLCAQIIKRTLKFLCTGVKLIQIWIKFRELMCQFCVCYFNIYNLYMYKHETFRNQLFGYLTFIKSVIGNLETTDRLTSYSVEVHSTVSSPSVSTVAHSDNFIYVQTLVIKLRPLVQMMGRNYESQLLH